LVEEGEHAGPEDDFLWVGEIREEGKEQISVCNAWARLEKASPLLRAPFLSPSLPPALPP